MCWRAQNSMNIDDKGSYATGMYAFGKQIFTINWRILQPKVDGSDVRKFIWTILTHDRRFGASGAYTEEGETAVDDRLLGVSLR